MTAREGQLASGAEQRDVPTPAREIVTLQQVPGAEKEFLSKVVVAALQMDESHFP